MKTTAVLLLILGVGCSLADNKCHGIVPKERKDCGYYGIQRDECESVRGCCFDHTVPNVNWCFFGKPVGTCSVRPEDRNDCGWYGIDQNTCEERGCCYDDTNFGFETKWCFYPTDNKCYGIVPKERKDCGYYGIQREECENVLGCCFDHTVPHVNRCFFGNPVDTCSVRAEDRNDCGWYGIDQDTCEDRGCCYDDTDFGFETNWCFYPTGYSLADESCSVSPNDRNDCGWYGIDQETCEGRGCCYDDTDFGFETKYCFYPTGHKCYGIAPEEREDCGYYGIQRKECESEGCCFDHTVPDVAWCFHGSEPAVPGEATVPPTEEEEGTESVPEEGTESPGEEGEEEPEPETAVPGEATVPPTEAEEGTESVPEEGTESPGEEGENEPEA